MDSVLIGALIFTFLAVTGALVVSLRHAGKIDKERHIR